MQLLRVNDEKNGGDACIASKDVLCELETDLGGSTVTYWGGAGALNAALSSQEKVQMHPWDEEMKECGQITKKAGPAMSKTVQGWIETVGGDGGRQGRGVGRKEGREKEMPRR